MLRACSRGTQAAPAAAPAMGPQSLRSPLRAATLSPRRACSRGKWAADIYDPACDDDYEWDDDDRPYGRSCASRPRKYLDKCCSEKNP